MGRKRRSKTTHIRVPVWFAKELRKKRINFAEYVRRNSKRIGI